MQENTNCKYNNKVSSKNAVFLFESSKKSIIYSISVYMKSKATSMVKRGATTEISSIINFLKAIFKKNTLHKIYNTYIVYF